MSSSTGGSPTDRLRREPRYVVWGLLFASVAVVLLVRTVRSGLVTVDTTTLGPVVVLVVLTFARHLGVAVGQRRQLPAGAAGGRPAGRPAGVPRRPAGPECRPSRLPDGEFRADAVADCGGEEPLTEMCHRADASGIGFVAFSELLD
jgi:hypothetical protein